MASDPNDEWRARYQALRTCDLEDVARHINREEFPDRAAIVDAELRTRTSPREPDSERTRILEQLARLKRWQVTMIGAWAGVIPAALLLGLPLGKGAGAGLLLFAIFFIAFAVLVYNGVRVSIFRCPRCLESFISRQTSFGRGNNPFATRCRNCGLTRDS